MSHIRSAEEEDFSGIIEIARQVVEEPDAFLFDEHCTTEELEAFWLPDLTMHAETFVLEASGFAGIIGAYVLYPAAHGRGAHMAHGSYMVAKHARGRGFGRALCEAFEGFIHIVLPCHGVHVSKRLPPDFAEAGARLKTCGLLVTGVMQSQIRVRVQLHITLAGTTLVESYPHSCA
ncbi:unnamed protein product [Symbiodinium microadriaticum]|nr:unnamed protein product [Symbiodinium sp. KB8]CAE7616240.1 unnamed protein product [Symbiodinium microadriaticum]